MKNDEQSENHVGIPVYGLFSKCSEERCRRISAIPYLTGEYVDNVKTNPVICAKDWPAKGWIQEK